jgi:type I restriction enzyme R subunit
LQADREQTDISAIIRELHGVVDAAIMTQSTIAEPKANNDGIYDISKIDFERLRREFEKSNTKRSTVQNLKEAVEKKLNQLLLQNPLRTDFQNHYQQLVEGYNQEKDRVTIEKTFADLMNLVKAMDDEGQRAARENLTEESLVVFDLLLKPDPNKKDIERIKKVAVELLATLKAERLKIDNWRDKEASRDAVKQQIHDFLYDDTTGLPVDDYSEAEIETLTENVFSHVYRAYPTVPSPIYR